MDTFCADAVGIFRFIGEVIYIIRIVIPLIIILLGTLDLGKAVLAGEDKKIKECQKTFIKRLIYGVAIFFLFTIVEVIFGLLGVKTNKGDSKICWDCATKPYNQSCIKYIDEEKEDNSEEKQDSDDIESVSKNESKEDV